MLEKLNENASLSQLITAFENSTNEIKTIKENIVNAIGNQVTLNDKLSIIPNKITSILAEKDKTISQLNSKYKVASGTVTSFADSTKIAYVYSTDHAMKVGTWIKISNLGFKPNIFFADFDYYDYEYKNNYKLFLFACCGITTQGGVDFSSVTSFARRNSDEYFHASGWIYDNSEGDVYFNDTGVQIPAYNFDSTQKHTYKWYAIKFN
ncbi:hypothetical protein KWY38_04250 [Clostridioides difficile]|nr:hypothetical protein [Clostridioides difficile]